MILLILTASVTAARHRAVGPPPPEVPGIVVSLISNPQPVASRIGRIVEWELVVRSQRTEAFTIQSIQVLNAGDGTQLARYSGDALRGLIVNLPVRNPPAQQDRIGGGDVAFIFFMLTFPADGVPAAMTHRIAITGGRGAETVNGPLMFVRTDAPAVLGAPLTGSSWVAANGPSNDTGHRRAVLDLGSKPVLAQRYAIDWIQIDRSGSTSNGDRRRNTSYYAYGQQVLAAADGVVSRTHDGIPENVPQQTPVVPITLDTIAGNYVILDLGDNRFALYAHLQPGSLRVKVGDRVTRGAPLALLGNSGNSSEPHLHFHVCDANASIECDGQPYVLDHFGTGNGTRRLEIPVKDDVVDFQ